MAIHDHGTFKGWVLSEELDEIVPPLRASPDDWLVRDNEVWRLPSAADIWADPDGDRQPGAIVGEGDRVEFSGLTNFDPVQMRFGPEGYEIVGVVPAGASFFCVKGDSDTLADALDFFFEVNREDFEPGELVEVECFDWSDRVFVLRGGRFVETDGA